MSDDYFRHKARLRRFERLYFRENLENGENTVYIEITSYSKARIRLLINERNEQNPDYFLKYSSNDNTNYFYNFGKLIRGTEIRSFPLDSRWGYFTFFNLESSSNIIELNVSRIRGNTLGIISFVLYTFVMFTIIILFFVIICLACINTITESQNRRRTSDRPRNQQQNLSSDGDEEESEEEEDEGPTLLVRDFKRFMPIVHPSKQDLSIYDFKNENCSICIDKIDNKEKVRLTRFCKHLFHDKCLRDWLLVNESCPNCKEDFTKPALEKKEQELKELEEALVKRGKEKGKIKKKKTKTLQSDEIGNVLSSSGVIESRPVVVKNNQPNESNLGNTSNNQQTGRNNVNSSEFENNTDPNILLNHEQAQLNRASINVTRSALNRRRGLSGNNR